VRELLTEAPNLRDVVWFPLMRPLSEDGADESGTETPAEEPKA